MSSPVRVGLVGLNDRARRLLIPGIVAAPRGRLTALCSRDLAKARDWAASLGPELAAFDSVASMANSGIVNVVFVNTPVAAHAAACLAAIDSGCGVICEKPLATTTAEATTLVAAAVGRGVRTVVNYTYRSVLGYRMVERLLDTQSLGPPRHAEFALLQGHGYLPNFPAGSALLESGVHLLDTLRGLCELAGFGRIVEVSAAPMQDSLTASLAYSAAPFRQSGESSREGAQSLDYGWAFTGRTWCGALVTGAFSRRSLGWRNGLRWSLYGDEAALLVELDSDRTDVRLARRGDGGPQGTWRIVAPPADLAADEARFPAYHMDRLIGAACGEEPFPDFAAAVATHRLADALAASAASGRWTPVDG